MRHLRHDIRQAWLRLRRDRAFALVTIATLALGIGANAAMFSLVRGVLLQPLPYGQPERLVAIWGSDLAESTWLSLQAQALSQPRFLTVLLVLFAAAALLLAAVGTYGTISLLVTERTREMGIRLALGADRGSVMRLVLGEGVRLTIAGLALGVAGALGLSQVLSGLVYGVPLLDPLTSSACRSSLRHCHPGVRGSGVAGCRDRARGHAEVTAAVRRAR